MIEYFVTSEIATKLKEKGFNGNCLAYYKDEKLYPIDTDFSNFREVSDSLVKAPLYVQLVDWFADKNIAITRLPFSDKYAVAIRNNSIENGMSSLNPSKFIGAFDVERAYLTAIDYL